MHKKRGVVGTAPRSPSCLSLSALLENRSNPVAGPECRQRGGIDVFNPFPAGDRCRHRLDLSRMLDVPAQKHGVILVLGVVAMFHVASGEFPEPDGHLDAVGTVSLAADPIDILAGPFFPFR